MTSDAEAKASELLANANGGRQTSLSQFIRKLLMSKTEQLLRRKDREVEARAGIEPACKDLQSSA